MKKVEYISLDHRSGILKINKGIDGIKEFNVGNMYNATRFVLEYEKENNVECRVECYMGLSAVFQDAINNWRQDE